MKNKAQVWIISRDTHGEIKVLLLKRTPESGSFWQPVTGGIEESESVEQGAARELFEETGFGVGQKLKPLDHVFEFEGRWGRMRESSFWVEVNQNYPTPKLDPKEHVAFEWVSIYEVEKRLPFEEQKNSFGHLCAALS